MPEPKQPVRPEESLAKMIEQLAEKTGKSLEEWKGVIAEKGWLKHGEIVSGIKSEFGISHGYANQIALRSKESSAASEDPIVEMFAKRPEAKAVFEKLFPLIQELGDDVNTAPKKGYLSVRRKKQFAILQPAAGRLDVGLQLKGAQTTTRLEASGSFNTMLSHRVRVSSSSEVDSELIHWLKEAYDAAG